MHMGMVMVVVGIMDDVCLMAMHSSLMVLLVGFGLQEKHSSLMMLTKTETESNKLCEALEQA